MTAIAPPRTRGPGRSAQLWRASPLTYVTLVAALLLSAFPLYWTVVTASRTNDVITSIPPPLVPGSNLAQNVNRLFSNADVLFARSLVNSAIVAVSVTVSVVLFSSLAGFAFAKLRFRGRNALLLVVIGTMMVPVQLGLIPLYMMMGWLGLQGELASVILPFLVSGFGVFLMRQYAAQAIPDELLEAARVDGASTFRIWLSIVLPLLRPAAAVLGLFTFMQTWNEFLWPYLALSPESPTVQVALSRLSSGYYTDMSLVLAGTAIATLPILTAFILFGRQIIAGISDGALKS